MPAAEKRDNRDNHDSSDRRIASLKQQNKEYNEMYRKWRIDHKNDYGFYFQGTSDELTYRDGEGFITEYPEASERSAVNEIHSVVAKTLIMYTLINILVFFLFSDLPISITSKITYSGGGFFTGDEKTAIIHSYAINIIRRIIPMFYLIHKVKMPFKIMLPTKISNKPLFYMAVPMAMFIFGISTLLSGVEAFGVSLFGIDNRNTIWLPENKAIMALSSILFTIIIPILSELIHRGIFLHILQQFGDSYALLLTAIITAFTNGNNRSVMFALVYSLVIGYFTMRSGSILTALVMRVVIACSSYWLTYIKLTWTDTERYLTVTLIVVFIYIAVGVASTVYFMKKHSNKINLPIYDMYISEKEKLMYCACNPLVLVWLSLSVLSLIISLTI